MHDKFYEEVDAGHNANVKPIIKHFIQNIFDPTKVVLFDLLFRGKDIGSA